MYESTDPTEFANYCMRFIELKSKSDIYPPLAIIEKFENC